MKKENIKIDILPNMYLNDDGTYNKDEAINFSGKIAGICYDKEGFEHLKNEPKEKTLSRIKRTLDSGHHSVYDHCSIIFNIHNIPKILAMVLNNEKQYTTSEKSARYTPIVRTEESIITEDEETLYNKWIKIFKCKIKAEYGNIYNDSKIQKLAQENARYLVTVFMPTEMVYTTTLRQINYLASFMEEYIKNAKNNLFENKLSNAMKNFLEELKRLNVLEDKLMINEKSRSLSLFGKDLDNTEDYFGNVYSTNYEGSFAQLAQAQRHRTLNYKMEMNDKPNYFIPPIIKDDYILINEWLNDIKKVSELNPQGELVKINEQGQYEDFILKCKERLCSAAQLEIMNQTKDTLLKYKEKLEEINSPLAQDIKNYSNGARCTFCDYTCLNDCKFKEGKTLKRKI